MPPVRPRKTTIKSVVVDGLRNKLSFEQIAEQIVQGFPDSKGALDPIRYIKYYQAAEGLSPKQQERIADERENQGFQRERLPLPPIYDKIGDVIFDDVVVHLYGGLYITYEAATKIPHKDVYTIYRCITGHNARSDATFYSVQGAVIGEIQNRWYLAAGKPLPPRVEANQAQRLEDVLMAKKNAVTEAGAAKAEKAPRVSIKSVITAGLLAGKDNDAIGAELVEMFPGKKAAENPAQHIAYYRHHLVADGQLEKQPRAKKEKAEKPAGAEKPVKGKKVAAVTVVAAPAKGKKAK